jgi:hypothetical protein
MKQIYVGITSLLCALYFAINLFYVHYNTGTWRLGDIALAGCLLFIGVTIVMKSRGFRS